MSQPTIETLWTARAHGGTQGMYRHSSRTTHTSMDFSVFVPDHVPGETLPVLWYLSCLTATPADITEKGEYRAACARHKLILVAGDTSPRGPDVPDDPAASYDFGLGAGFYLDATEFPFAQHYRMESYLIDDLPALIAAAFPADMSRQAILGHSMGGHGALTLALRHPGRFRSVSALAPIVSPSQTPWGRKALAGYLGVDETGWRAHDAVRLIEDGASCPEILVDQGSQDAFLAEQLRPDLLARACEDAGIGLTLNMRTGYDHAYYFVASFLASQIDWHAARLT
jgi:S-formylglutathione hydrolase